MQLKQGAACNLMLLMVDSADHLTGKTGLTLTISASKNGGAFASISPTVTERGFGWYALALTSSHTDTLGDLALHVTATGADVADLLRQVAADGEGSYSANDLLRMAAGYAAGKTTVVKNGTRDHTFTFRNVTDAGPIIASDVVNGERTSVTLTP